MLTKLDLTNSIKDKIKVSVDDSRASHREETQ